MKNQNPLDPKDQRENLKILGELIGKNLPDIKNILELNKTHERKMFTKEIFFGGMIILAVGLLTYFGKLSGETLAGLIGVIIGYVGARQLR